MDISLEKSYVDLGAQKVKSERFVFNSFLAFSVLKKYFFIYIQHDPCSSAVIRACF